LQARQLIELTGMKNARPAKNKGSLMEHRIIEKSPLLGNDGRLVQKGYATAPLLEYNPEALQLSRLPFVNRLRLKEWDYYGVWSGERFFSITISHIGYAGLIFAYVIDFKNGRIIEKGHIVPLGRGVELPRTSLAGDAVFEHNGLRVAFFRQPEGRHIELRWPDYSDGQTLEADLHIEHEPGRDSIVMSTPMQDRCFYYNEKIPAMPVSGRVSLPGFFADENFDNSLAVLDWGRGVWPYKSYWNWASAFSRLPDGRKFALNMGCGFGDLSYATENCFFIDGRLHKIGPLSFDYESGSYLKPWRFSDAEGRLKLTMQPIFERVAKSNLLLINSEVHQVFGRYEGTVENADGQRIEISGLTGWAEEHKARW